MFGLLLLGISLVLPSSAEFAEVLLRGGCTTQHRERHLFSIQEYRQLERSNRILMALTIRAHRTNGREHNVALMISIHWGFISFFRNRKIRRFKAKFAILLTRCSLQTISRTTIHPTSSSSFHTECFFFFFKEAEEKTVKPSFIRVSWRVTGM